MSAGPYNYDWTTPEVRAAVEAASASTTEVAQLARQVAEIPAPTFDEAERAEFVRSTFAARGYEAVGDEAGNVTVTRQGNARGNALLLAAHTDTVFPRGIDLRVTEETGRLRGPGIGDNSLAVAALLTLPRLLDAAGLRTQHDLILCANTGEEGLGDLRGMKRAVADHRAELGAVIAIEGHNLGRLTRQAVGSRRFRVAVQGPGGHSWGAFGKPSAIHALGQMIAEIAALPVPKEPKTTFNVGLVEGGVSVNTIAPSASFVLDLRSVDAMALDTIVAQVNEIVARHNTGGIQVTTEVLGDRPTGSQDADAPILQLAQAVLRELHMESVLDASSTDANVPIALGIPAVCIGLTTGGLVHREDEYIDITPIGRGMQQLVLLVAGLAGVQRA